MLASADWERHRPRVVLVEAVDGDGRPTHEAWEPALLGAGYRLALFDGLNRFYCRDEDAERLLPRLAAPANVLDNWRPVREVDASGPPPGTAGRGRGAECRDERASTREASRRGGRSRQDAALEARAGARRGAAGARGRAQQAHEETQQAHEAEAAAAHERLRFDLLAHHVTVRDASRLARLMRRGAAPRRAGGRGERTKSGGTVSSASAESAALRRRRRPGSDPRGHWSPGGRHPAALRRDPARRPFAAAPWSAACPVTARVRPAGACSISPTSPTRTSSGRRTAFCWAAAPRRPRRTAACASSGSLVADGDRRAPRALAGRAPSKRPRRRGRTPGSRGRRGARSRRRRRTRCCACRAPERAVARSAFFGQSIATTVGDGASRRGGRRRRGRRSRSPAPAGVGERRDRASRDSVRLYYWIHHTGEYDRNTGVQRVVRNLAIALAGGGHELVPVRWCPEREAIVRAEQRWLAGLARFGGPALPARPRRACRSISSSADAGRLDGELAAAPRGAARRRRRRAAAAGRFDYARFYGLRTAAVFYDLIPLRQPGYERTAAAHEHYVRSLVAADLVIGDLRHAAGDLRAWWAEQGYEPTELPACRRGAARRGDRRRAARRRRGRARAADPLHRARHGRAAEEPGRGDAGVRAPPRAPARPRPAPRRRRRDPRGGRAGGRGDRRARRAHPASRLRARREARARSSRPPTPRSSCRSTRDSGCRSPRASGRGRPASARTTARWRRSRRAAAA